ncbi:hypothetical protein [Anaeromassilibacillus senegalensis]|uniref:hypothetical protein n=1 Tax=Anaeromassilibacillus senegalensis TaxID=1673717 RepID=UPI000680F690|nr:hypothetical protein [Anaeromassilibacillus senegalensis]
MGYRMNIPSGEYLAGLEEATQGLQEFVDNMESGGAQGLADIALYILGEAVQRAPVDNGDLRGSGYVTLDGAPYAKGVGPEPGTVITGPVPEIATLAEVGFSEKYAADQHEQTGYSHREGRSKYLESVIVDDQGELQRILIERLLRVMGGDGSD